MYGLWSTFLQLSYYIIILLFLVLGCITSSDDIQPVQLYQINDYANHYVHMWILKLMDAEHCTTKVLEAGA